MSIKGFQSVFTTSKNQIYLTIQKLLGGKTAIESIAKTLSEVTASTALGANSSGNNLQITSHNAKVNDVIKFLNGNAVGMEVQVIAIVDANNVTIENSSIPFAVGNNVSVNRYTTLASDSSGNLNITPGPIKFVQDGVDVEVEEDTVTPANNVELPVKDLTAHGKLDDILNALGLDIVDHLDSALLDISVTNIPASAGNPVEVVASLASDVKKIKIVEDIGEFIGLYTGPALGETLKAVLPLGGGDVELEIPSGTRISLRHMKNSAIATNTYMAINFLG